ncbi:MAG: HAMP domain-containing sensor histidine kinase [Gemmataceae bacterium]
MSGPENTGKVWRYLQALVAPLAIWLLLGAALFYLNHEERYDKAALLEWLQETRNPDYTLPELASQYAVFARDYLEKHGQLHLDLDQSTQASRRLLVKREEIYEHLKTLGEPATKAYPGLLLLFPTVYRLEVRFHAENWPRLTNDEIRPERPIVWDSGQEPGAARYKSDTFPLGDSAVIEIHYQLRAWNKRQRDEQWRSRGLLLLVLLGAAATGLGLAWLMLAHDRETLEEQRRRLAQYQLVQAERQLLQESARHAETERELLAQRLATQEARRKALELETNLYANIGIMAGSYAHNIKNLLVRPNDLLRRCMESEESGPGVRRMLQEVEQTLGLVTDRLQQILQTVRRDPSQAREQEVDLNDLVRMLGHTWTDIAADRWQLDLVIEPASEVQRVRGDLSHLQQAVENLLFNARDATFERRNQLREAARRDPTPARRQAILDAATWRGRVNIRVRPGAQGPILEVQDNGVGMTEEVRRRCTETHFSTKRDNALYEGLSTGMGLGLSFVASILENHRASMTIDSTPGQGTTFRLGFPLPQEVNNAGSPNPA